MPMIVTTGYRLLEQYIVEVPGVPVTVLSSNVSLLTNTTIIPVVYPTDMLVVSGKATFQKGATAGMTELRLIPQPTHDIGSWLSNDQFYCRRYQVASVLEDYYATWVAFPLSTTSVRDLRVAISANSQGSNATCSFCAFSFFLYRR